MIPIMIVVWLIWLGPKYEFLILDIISNKAFYIFIY